MNPTPSSPAAILRDRAYRVVHTSSAWAPGGVECAIVVLHHGSERYYRTRYTFNSVDWPAQWELVERYERVVTEWRSVQP